MNETVPDSVSTPTPPSPLPSFPPLSVKDRIIRSLVASVFLAVMTLVFWFCAQFMVAAQVEGRIRQETLGYAAIILAPVGGLVAGIAGLVVGGISRRGKLRWNILLTQLVFVAICAGLITFLMVDSKPAP